MVDIDLVFPHSYHVEEVLELPGTGDYEIPVFFFPIPKLRTEHDGLWLQLRDALGRSWIGVFGFGVSSPAAISRVLSWPDQDKFCVISRGAAYLVRSDDPGVWERLSIFPVRYARLIPELQLVILADFTSLYAFNSQGLAWRNRGVCGDDLRILKVEAGRIEGVGYEPANGCDLPFWIDLITGNCLLPSLASVDGNLNR